VRHAFTAFGFAVRRFTKMPGHDGHELRVPRTGAQAFWDEGEERQRGP